MRGLEGGVVGAQLWKEIMYQVEVVEEGEVQMPAEDQGKHIESLGSWVYSKIAVFRIFKLAFF